MPTWNLDVANAARFARDVKAQNAMKNAVASMADVSLDLVTVSNLFPAEFVELGVR